MPNAIMYLGEKLAGALSAEQSPNNGNVVNHVQKAMDILKTMSKDSLLSKEQIAKAMNIFIDENKARVFCLMEDSEIRLAYLNMELGIPNEEKDEEE